MLSSASAHVFRTTPELLGDRSNQTLLYAHKQASVTCANGTLGCRTEGWHPAADQSQILDDGYLHEKAMISIPNVDHCNVQPRSRCDEEEESGNRLPGSTMAV